MRWQNCSSVAGKGLLCRPVDPFHAEKQSQGRILVTIVNALLIKKITFFDVGIYRYEYRDYRVPYFINWFLYSKLI